MTASAQGTDVSSYQPVITAAEIRAAGLSFAFAKATEGLSGEDPEFAANWAVIASAGVARGAYHELTSADPAAQAALFMAAVVTRGLRPGDMLACVASDYAVTGAQAKAFLDLVAEGTGPQNPVLLYSDLSALPSLAACSAYPLWIAYYSGTAPASVAPWARWTFWQYQAGGGADGGDRDAFNGTAAELSAWIGSHNPPSPPAPPVPSPVPAWQEQAMKALPLVTEGSKDTQAVRTVQGLLCARGHPVAVDGAFGGLTLRALRDFQAARGLAVDGIAGPATWVALLGV